MKILVSGAGIGGSAAILFLQAGGHQVVAIEKTLAFSRRGYILSLKYFGLGIMKSLGLYEELKRSGMPFHTIQIRDGAATGCGNVPRTWPNRQRPAADSVQPPDPARNRRITQ